MTAEPPYGLRGALVRGLRLGLLAAPVVTVGALLLPEDGQVLAWGVLLAVGAVFMVLGVLFDAQNKVLMRVEARMTKQDQVAPPHPWMRRGARGLLWAGLAMVMSGLLLSAVLLASGETLV